MGQDTKGFALVTGLRPASAPSTPRKVELIAANLGKRKDLAKVEAVLRTDRRITILVNNAGDGSTAPLLQADVEALAQGFPSAGQFKSRAGSQ